MKKDLTKAYVSSERGCYSKEQVDGLSFMKKDNFHIKDVVKSEIPLKDKFWFVIRKCELTIRQKQDLAIGCAEIVLAIYESKYPESKAPREAIQAAKDFLAGVITLEVLIQKRDAANKARNHAYAAYAAAAAAAADAAAYAAAAAADAAAYAAAAAAYAAADAAYAAADAAAAAAYAAADAAYAAAARSGLTKIFKRDFANLLLKFLITFIDNN
jgi:uncharacterized membrane protein YqiK